MFADDFSGACDTGAQFARRGMSCRVQLRVSERRTTAMTEVPAFNQQPQRQCCSVSTKDRRDCAPLLPFEVGIEAMRLLGCEHPRIAMCGINPHAGEMACLELRMPKESFPQSK